MSVSELPSAPPAIPRPRPQLVCPSMTPVSPPADVPPPTSVASAGPLPATPITGVSSAPLPAACAACDSRAACAHICSLPADAPESRPGPADLSLPELLARVLRDSSATAPPPPAREDRTDLAVRALAGLPVGIRLWLAKEGLSSRTFTSFKGLALLDSHLSGKAFASPELRLDCIAELLESHGVEPGLLRHPTYGIHDDWGRSEYRFSDDVSALNTVLAAVDEFITLCDGPLPSPWMSFSPLAHFAEAQDWQTGMPHRPLERAQWSRIPGGSRWANHMLRFHFSAVPKIPVRTRISKNSRALRPRDPLFDSQQSDFVRRKLGEELQQGVVSRRRRRPAVTSAILCVPKEGSSDKYRKVENMSHFKDNFEPQHFKMETMSQFPTIFGPGFFVFKLDFKAAYHNFLVASTLRDLFGVEFEGEFYTYNSLPFGFRLSAYWLHRMVKVVATYLRSQGHAVLPYLDDGIYGAPTFVSTVRYRNYAVRLWESLGLRFSHAAGKCWLTPTQSLEGLGIVVHLASACPTYHMPVRKVDTYLAESRALLEIDDLWPILKLARLAGLLMSAALAIPVSKLLCRPLFECMYVGSGERPERKRVIWSDLVRSSVDVRHELEWLLRHMLHENCRGAPIWLDPSLTVLSAAGPVLVLSQDASHRGAGWLVHSSDPAPALPFAVAAVLLICWEYFSGSASGSAAFLRANALNPLAVVLLVDILPEDEALRYIPACYIAAGRVLYHRIVGDAIVDIPLFESLVVRKWPGASLKHLVKLILTPPCTTLSLAARFLDCFGQPGHPSRPDGVNGRRRRPEAIDADRLRLRVTMVARDVADALSDTVRIMFENPLALYRRTTDAQMLLAYRSASHAKRWRLVTLCHCLHADHDTPTSMKPSDYLVFGYGLIPDEACDGSCPLSIPGTGLHRYVISNASRHPGQTRITGHLRQRVPTALFDYLDRFRDVATPVDDSFVASALASGTVRFTPSESQMHQAARELYGLAMAFRAASSDPSMRGRRFRVRVDAMVTVWYFRNSGGRSGLLNRIYRFLWEQLRAVGSSIVEMVHVPGSQFVIEGTDRLSRPLEPPLNSIADRDEWRVERSWFARIQDWAQCTFAADLFADRDNHRLPLFYSASCCADAVGHPDCFANVWPPGVVLYAFPPIGLIPRLLQRALDSDAHVVLLVPDWPSQPWWPRLMSMTVSSWFIGRRPGLFERRTESSGSWGYVAVASPFYELRVCRIHASTAASTSLGISDPTSGLRLTADAASSLVGPVALARNALVTAAASVPPM